jgi:hypothetical protein
MKITNAEILGFSKKFDEAFEQETNYLPARVNFYIHYNVKLLLDAVEVIEFAKKDICVQYGVPNEDGTKYVFTEENTLLANKELFNLASLEQEIPIHTIPLSWLDGLQFTPEQMRAIMFMIEVD